MPPADEDDRPRRRPRREDAYDDYDDEDDDDRPRRRRRPQGDATGGLIPYKNGMALAAYYLGVFGLIPVLGFPLSIGAVVLGVLGLKHAKAHPEASGTAHALVGIALGSVELLGYIALVGLVVAGVLSK